MCTRPTDLFAAFALAAVGAIVVCFVPLVPIRTTFALPLLLVLPGYCCTAAVFPQRRLDWARRLLLSLGLSLSIDVLGALVLNLTPFGLRPASWSVLLVMLIWASGWLAWRRRDAGGGTLRIHLGIRRRDLLAVFRGGTFRIHLGVGKREVFAICLAALICGGAVAFARTPLPAKDAHGYTALWLRLKLHSAHSVVVHVQNDELGPVDYRLTLHVGLHLRYKKRELRLVAGQTWPALIDLHSSRRRRVTARLYRAGRPGVVYRYVWLPTGRQVSVG
jgi:uncharacterized membrane protein